MIMPDLNIVQRWRLFICLFSQLGILVATRFYKLRNGKSSRLFCYFSCFQDADHSKNSKSGGRQDLRWMESFRTILMTWRFSMKSNSWIEKWPRQTREPLTSILLLCAADWTYFYELQRSSFSTFRLQSYFISETSACENSVECLGGWWPVRLVT